MANFNFNKVILAGRMTADPELKTTPSGISVVQFVIAVNRNYRDENGKSQADFLNVTAWRGTAEFIMRYFRKASSICVVGSIQTRTWTDKLTGQKRFGVGVVADEAFFVDTKAEMPAAARVGMNSAQAVVDPESPAMAGAPESGEKAQEQLYATPGARGEMDALGSEEELPF